VKLKLAHDLALPSDEAVTQKYGFIGRSGSGKSYAAMKLAELFLEDGAQIIALDWVGIWWSLRLAADGKAPGFEHVYIFGGEHADVDLRPESGALMADLVVDKHISVVLDVMHFRKAERTRFATAFAERFFHRKKTARTACHLFIEEAQAYLPQMVRGDEARMVGVFEDIGKVGRNYGIGNSLISQRPQAINKDVLNQVEVLFAFQTNGPQERKTIAGWTAENTDAGAAMVQELPKLKVGHALVWSPQWLRVAKPVHITERITYDASSTPGQKAKSIRPNTLAKADLEQLGEQITATIEKAKAEDPLELRKQIAELRKQLSAVSHQPSAKVETKTVEKFVLKDGQLARAEKLLTDFEALQERHVAALQGFWQKVDAPLEAIAAAIKATRAPQQNTHATMTQRVDRQVPVSSQGRRVAPAPATSRPASLVSPSSNGHGDISPARQKILNGLAFLHGIGVAPADKTQLALIVGVSPTSGGYFNNLGALRSSGLIDYPSGGTVALTDSGAAVASTDGVPSTTDELHDAIRAKLPAAKWKIVEQLIAIYPKPIAKDALAERIGVSPTSGGYFNNLGSLRSLGLIEYPQGGMVVAQPVLFLEG
jgi:Mn-dependent DtxR family transcriptional regulator